MIQALSTIRPEVLPPLPESVANVLRSGRLSQDQVRDRLRFWHKRCDVAEFLPLLTVESAADTLQQIARMCGESINHLEGIRREVDSEAQRLAAYSVELKNKIDELRRNRDEALAKLTGAKAGV